MKRKRRKEQIPDEILHQIMFGSGSGWEEYKRYWQAEISRLRAALHQIICMDENEHTLAQSQTIAKAALRSNPRGWARVTVRRKDQAEMG